MSRRPSALLACLVLLSACTGVDRLASPTATVQTTGSSAATGTPTPADSPTLTPSPSPSPSPRPTSGNGMGGLDLEATGCPGGVVLEWSPASDPRFHHYTALRSASADIATPWPPIAPAVDWGDTYATDPFVTSAVDSSILPSDTEWNYRVMAYDLANRALAASPVRQARLAPVERLGTLTAAAAPGGGTLLEWRPFEGPAACFSSYRVTFAIGGGAPDTVLSVISGQEISELHTDALHPGTTYALRVQAMRTTTLGSFVVAETEVATYVVPGT